MACGAGPATAQSGAFAGRPWKRVYIVGLIFDNIVVGILLVVVGIPVIASYWYKASVRTSEHELKRSMVERGMSAEDIERVIAARRGKASDEVDGARGE